MPDFRSEDSRIARQLAGVFESVYLISLSDDSFACLTYPEGTVSEPAPGAGFFEWFSDQLCRIVHPEDKEYLLRSVKKEAVLKSLTEKGSCTIVCRCAAGERRDILFFSFAEGKMLLCATLTDQKQTGYLMRRLEEHMDAAYDPLTLLGNRHAFRRHIALIEKEIRNRTAEFAVVMCDVNNLKRCNDTIGHLAGSQMVVDASVYISEVFSHSQIYHIGGDEFAAILRKEDYVNRDALLAEFRKQRAEEGFYGKLEIASGMSVYDPSVDRCFDDVLSRADVLMYENKAFLKQGAPR